MIFKKIPSYKHNQLQADRYGDQFAMKIILVVVLIYMCLTPSNSRKFNNIMWWWCHHILNKIIIENQCKTPDGHNANCVKLQQCPHLSKLLTTPPLSDANKLFLQKSQCGFYKGEPYVCCGPPKSDENNLLPKPGVCGHFTSDRIFGGEKTQIDEFPWLALIQYTKGLSIFIKFQYLLI